MTTKNKKRLPIIAPETWQHTHKRVGHLIRANNNVLNNRGLIFMCRVMY